MTRAGERVLWEMAECGIVTSRAAGWEPPYAPAYFDRSKEMVNVRVLKGLMKEGLVDAKVGGDGYQYTISRAGWRSLRMENRDHPALRSKY